MIEMVLLRTSEGKIIWYDHHDHFPDAVDKPEGTSSNDEVDDSTVILIQQLKPAGFTFDSVPRVDEVDLGYDDLS